MKYNPANGLLISLLEVNTIEQNTFQSLAGVTFLIVAIAHVLRLAFKWEVIVAGRFRCG